MGAVRHFTCNLCEAMCGLRVTVEGGRVSDVRADPDDVHSRGHICPKGPALRELHEDPDRLRAPVRRTAAGWEPIAWDDALDLCAGRLRAIQRRHGRSAVGLYIGNPTVHSLHASLGSQALALALRTNNRFDPNSQDSAPRLFACMQLYGDVTALPVPDVDRTSFLLVLGANPAATNGSMMSLGDARGRLRAIRARGGRLVVVDPRRTETAAIADAHHFIRPGGDAALLLAILSVLFAEALVDEARVRQIATGLDALRAIAARFPPERVAPATGVDAAVIRALARDLAAAEGAVVYGRLGTCQNELGPLASWLIEAVNVVTGNFDRPGGVMFATPAADVGALARLVLGSGHGRFRSRVRGLPELLGALPSAVMTEEMETPGEGRIRAFVCFAGNPVLSTPGGDRLGRALAGLDFVVAIDPYVNETSRHAHVILPPAHVFEVGNYELIPLGLAVRNVAGYSPPILDRAPGARDDWEITSELAARLVGPSPRLARGAARLARDLPERVVDLLLRAGPCRLSLDALRAAPHGVDLGPLVPSRRARVRTPGARVRLAPEVFVREVPRIDRWLDDHGSPGEGAGLRLVGRRHLRSNNSWMHNLRSLVKGPDRAQLLMHPVDAARLGLAQGSRVRVRSRAGEVPATLAVTEDMRPGVVSLPHGFGHAAAAETLRVAGALAGPNVNVLTDAETVEPLVGASILSGLSVSVTREEGEGAG
jgi:anaerobic selenocysteine-containing dehydrogenase